MFNMFIFANGKCKITTKVLALDDYIWENEGEKISETWNLIEPKGRRVDDCCLAPTHQFLSPCDSGEGYSNSGCPSVTLSC